MCCDFRTPEKSFATLPAPEPWGPSSLSFQSLWIPAWEELPRLSSAGVGFAHMAAFSPNPHHLKPELSPLTLDEATPKNIEINVRGKHEINEINPGSF